MAAGTAIVLIGLMMFIGASNVLSQASISDSEGPAVSMLAVREEASRMVSNTLPPLFWTIVSYAYFRRSERARNTFGANIPPLWR
jgi:hypothetical protein